MYKEVSIFLYKQVNRFKRICILFGTPLVYLTRENDGMFYHDLGNYGRGKNMAELVQNRQFFPFIILPVTYASQNFNPNNIYQHLAPKNLQVNNLKNWLLKKVVKNSENF